MEYDFFDSADSNNFLMDKSSKFSLKLIKPNDPKTCTVYKHLFAL